MRSEQAARKIVIDAAAQEFLSRGFGKASMTDIAQRAGISTRTLYRIAPGKADLFRIVVEQRIAMAVERLAASTTPAASLGDEVYRLTRAYARIILSDEVTGTIRLLFGEMGQFPDLAENLRQSSAPIAEAFERQVITALTRHAYPGEDLTIIPQVLRLMVIGMQRQWMIGAGPVNEEDLDALLRRAVRALVID